MDISSDADSAPRLEPYWCSLPADKLGERLLTKVQEFEELKLTGVIRQRDARSYSYYYGLSPSGVHATSHVLRGGDEGELAEVRVNHSRSLLNALLNLITAPRLVWQATATNADYDSLRETELANAILEYYWQERQVNLLAARGLESALGFAEGFVLLGWDKHAGDAFAGDLSTGAVEKSGDASIKFIPKWDVYRDPSKGSWEEVDWTLVRLRLNKFTLAKQNPSHAEEILACTSDGEILSPASITDPRLHHESDDITVYLFLHKPTAALEEGRKALMLPDGTILPESDETMPIQLLHRVSAGEQIGTSYGYTPYYEILGPQELMDSLETSVATNQSTFGTQNILAPHGCELSPDDLVGGARIIYYPADAKPPEALQLTSTPKEIFDNLDRLQKAQELLIGINSVVRGEPQSSEMPGNAMALLSAQALQQASGIQANYIAFVEAIGSSLVQLIQANLSVPRKIALVGKANAFLVTDVEYSGESIGRIKRVSVDVGNPLSQTSAGRVTLADNLLEKGLIKTPEQYVQVLSSGRLEPLTQALNHQLLLIRSENESLALGEPVQALALDDHMLHVREHSVVIANPQARKDPNVVKAVLAHIQHHQDLYENTPVSTLMMMGQQPPPWLMQGPPPGEGPPGGEGGPPPGAPLPPPGDPGSGAPPPPAEPGLPPGGPGSPDLPSMPTNPVTGQEFNPVDGGGFVPS